MNTSSFAPSRRIPYWTRFGGMDTRAAYPSSARGSSGHFHTQT